MLDIKSAADACEKAIAELGAKKYSFSTVEGETREFNVDGGKFTLFRTLFDNAVSITLYRDGRKGSAVTNRFEEDAIVRAAADADSAAQAADADEAWDIAPKYDFPVKHDGVYDADLDLLFSRTRELLEDIKTNHPKIIVEQLIVDPLGEFGNAVVGQTVELDRFFVGVCYDAGYFLHAKPNGGSITGMTFDLSLIHI